MMGLIVMSEKKDGQTDYLGVIIERIFLKTTRSIGITLSDNTINTIVQFVKFGIVGVSNTLISYLINVTVLVILQPYCLSWDYVAANTLAFLLSVLWSFYWNNKFVFNNGSEKRSRIRSLLRAYMSYAFTGIVLSNFLSFFWIHYCGVSKFVAPLINLIICVPLNFYINKHWTFN